MDEVNLRNGESFRESQVFIYSKSQLCILAKYGLAHLLYSSSLLGFFQQIYLFLLLSRSFQLLK